MAEEYVVALGGSFFMCFLIPFFYCHVYYEESLEQRNPSIQEGFA